LPKKKEKKAVKQAKRLLVQRNVPKRALMERFKIELDLTSDLFTSATEREHSYGFHLMSELAGALEHHQITDDRQVIHESSETNRKRAALTFWLGVVKTTLWSVLGLGSAAGIGVLLWYCRSPITFMIGRTIRRLRNRWTRRPGTVATQAVELKEARDSSTTQVPESVQLLPDRVVFTVVNPHLSSIPLYPVAPHE
jgi:hypothetical protein